MTDAGTLPFTPRSGVESYDLVTLNEAPPEFAEVAVLNEGLSLLVQPAMSHVTEMKVPPTTVDVAIWIQEPVRLEERPAPEFPVHGLRPETLILAPTGMETRWSIAGGMPEAIHLHIGPAFRDTYREDAGRALGAVEPRINLAHPAIGRTLVQARGLLTANAPFRKLALQILGLEAARHALQIGGGRAGRVPSSAMTPVRLRRVREYVDAHLAEDIGLEELARVAGLSASHFARAFRMETGESPYAWIIRLRIERVTHLLLSTHLGLAEIAATCGFASQSHMTDTFRRAAGMPPGQWRRQFGRA